MKLRRAVVLQSALAIAGVPAMARAQFTYQAPSTSSQDTVGVWNDFNGVSGTAPVSIYGISPWQTVPWPSSGACTRQALYSQQPSFSPGDWQLGTFQGRGPAYQITLGPGNTSILNNRLELNTAPGPTAALGTPNGTCLLLFEPASTCSVAGGCISSAYFKWSTYISSAAVLTDGLSRNNWGGDLFQMHPIGTLSSGTWPQLSVELDGNANPYLAFFTQCTAGTAGCIQVDPNDPSSTALNWKPFLSPGYVGRWVDFAFYIKLSTGSDGVQTLWVDGQQVATWNGPNIYSDSSGHPRLNVQHGYYRLSKATSTLPLYQTPILYSTTSPSCSPDFVVSASPSSVSGASASSTITVTPSCGFSGTVSLSASGVPAGASATLSPTSVTVSGSTSANSALSLSQGSAPSGTYTITVTGTSGTVSHSAPITYGIGSAAYSDALWVQQLGTGFDEYGWGAATDPSGNVFVTGYTTGAFQGLNQGGQDVAVAKYSPSGALLWTAQLGSTGDEHAYAAATDSAGNLFVAGSTTDAMWNTYNGGLHDGFVAMFGPNGGGELWSNTIGTAGDDFVYAIAVDGSGNIYVAGSTTGAFGGANAGGTDGWVAKYDQFMTPVWIRQFGGAGNEVARGVALDAAGNVYVAGSTTAAFGGAAYSGGLHDAFLVKYDNNGVLQWTKIRGTAGDDVAYAVAVTGGNPVVCGSTTGSLGFTNAGGYDGWVGEYTAANGAYVLERQIGSAGDEEAFGVATDTAGDIFIAGSNTAAMTAHFQGGYDVFVAKYNSAGTRQWIKTLGSVGDEVGLAATATGTGVYVIGGTTGSLAAQSAGGKDIFVAQFAQ